MFADSSAGEEVVAMALFLREKGRRLSTS